MQHHRDGEASGRPTFRDMDPDAKLQFRRKERDAKKDRERTLGYFQSAKTALDDTVREGLDGSMVSGIVDGLFSELLKKLRDDPQLFLLRNGVVCRAIEAAVLHNSNLLHTKTTLYQLLGKIDALAASPTSSFVLEALLNNLSMLLALSDDPTERDTSLVERVESEVDPDGAGSHPGSGLPNAYTLLERVEGEVKEKVDALLVDNGGSRVLRALCLVLAGLPPSLRQEDKVVLRSSSHRPVFEDLLTHLAQAILDSVERVYMPDASHQAPRRADAWVAAASCTTASLVIQTLLRCGTVPDVNALLRKKFESLTLRNSDGEKTPLLASLLRDPLGSHVFQAYLKMPPTVAEQMSLQRSTDEATSASEAFVRQLEKKSHPITQTEVREEWWSRARREHSDCFHTPWDVSLGYVLAVLDSELLCEGSEEVRQASFLLQDLATFAPSLLHLGVFWEEVLQTRLQQMVDIPALTAVLVRFTRKCAHDGTENPQRTASADARPSSSFSVESNSAVSKDQRAGARYFPCPVDFRKAVSSAIMNVLKPLHVKGPWQALLVEQMLGEHVGFEIVGNLLLFGPVASAMLLHALDKLNVEGLKAVALHPQGSHCLQQWIKCAAQAPSRSAKATPNSKEDKALQDGGLFAVRRLARRMAPMLEELAGDKSGCHVVEGLFDAAPMDVKETVVQQLVPLFQRAREAQKAPTAAVEETRKRQREENPEEDVGAAPPLEGSTLFYQSKVFSKLCVEQYLHRADEWRSNVAKVQHVQRLMTRILSATEA